METIAGYTLLEKLHSNAYNIASHRALRLHDRQLVIIKLPALKDAGNKEFALLQHEYQLLKRLNGTGIIQVYGLIQPDVTPILILEDINGQFLDKFLAGKPVDLPTFFNIALQLVDIIGHLHRHHIIHKDIKPGNLIIKPKDLTVVLADFSIASQLSEEMPSYVNPEILEGSLAYLSPEQTGRMNCPIDYRTDYYSLGITLFEMLTGKLPFSANDSSEWIHCHVTKPPPLVTDLNPLVPTMLANIVNKLLAKTPKDRYASNAGLKADLIECKHQWEQKKQIALFTPGQHDTSDHLHLSHRLYGRQTEITQLLTAFERVAQGRTELLLVSGYSGIGKTSLINEIHKPIVYNRGYFINGKFDQLQRSTPYSAIITAFNELISYVQTESRDKIAKIRQTLLNALGNIGQVIIEVIPELEKIIGTQPPIPELPPTEAQNRFNFVFPHFVQAFATAENRLVIFLDDLQWADSASLLLIKTLLSNPDIRYTLLLGAYRSNEVNSAHPLMQMIRSLEHTSCIVHTLELQPLKLVDTQNMLADSLNCAVEKVITLAACLQEKTLGNPFFINEFLKTLYQKNLIYFAHEQDQWQWNIDTIKQENVTANVIDLLMEKIHTLPDTTQEILKLAACIGYQFNLQTLVVISQQPLQQVAQSLWDAIKINLLVPLGKAYLTATLAESDEFTSDVTLNTLSYSFIHDRVQQAAYELIPESIRQQTHLKIGRLLLNQKTLEENDDRLFEIMDQLNHSLALLTDPVEKQKIAEYNLWAGKKSITASAYQTALNYLQAGLLLLKPFDWQKNYELIFALQKELANCQYLVGEFTEAQVCFSELLSHAKDILDKVAIYRLNIEMLSVLNKHHEAIALGLNALKLLGVKIANKPSALHIMFNILKIKLQTRGKKIEDITLAPITSLHYRAAIDLISQLFNSAFIADQKLFVLLACKNMNLSFKYGYTESTSMSCLVYAFTLMHSLNWYQEGLSFIALYDKLKTSYGEAAFEGINRFILGTFINPYRSGSPEYLKDLSDAYQLTRNVGRLAYSNYCNLLATLTSLAIGKPLPEIKKYSQHAIDFVAQTKINDFAGIHDFYKYTFKCLKDHNAFNIEAINIREKAILQDNNNTELSFYYSQCVKLCYLFGAFPESLQAAMKYQRYAEYGIGLLSSVEYQVYYGLTLLALYKQAPRVKRLYYLKVLRNVRSYLQSWASWCPENFACYLYLLDAEFARIRNKTSLAINLYEKALTSAKTQDFIHVIGMINECAGRCYLEAGLIKLANIHFTESYTAYQRWGANAKCQLLKQQYPEYLPASIEQLPTPVENKIPLPSPVEPQPVDMVAIIKSTQLISSEIQLDKLLQNLLTTALQITSAQRVVLLSQKGQQWVIEAEGTPGAQAMELPQTIPLNTSTNLPLTLFQIIQKTQDPILIDDATSTDQTVSDPYIQRTQPKSLLMIPIFQQGQLHRVLYLEHQEKTHAFTAQHFQELQLLMTQAAISIENAYLYYQATHDPLTGLANRNLLYQTFNYVAAQANREKKQVAILMLDLDHLKWINDTLGNEIGDQVLIYIASRLKTGLRENDVAAHLGGDEFVIMLANIEDIKQINIVVKRLLADITQTTFIQDHEINLAISIGISLYPEDGKDIQTLLKQADIALSQAKTSGHNHSQYYSHTLNLANQELHNRETELQQALERNELCFYYQPIYDAKTKQITNLEALIRWQHPEKGLIGANEIIPLAEKTGLIIPIGEWALRTACQQNKTWQEQGIAIVPIAVNLSALQTRNTQVSKLVLSILEETKLNPKYLELELTEMSFIETNPNMLYELKVLRDNGVILTIDDFGTGFSALGYLRRLPLHKIKIDRLFVKDILTDPENRAIALTIITLAHQLNMQVVAEGVETAEQYEFLSKQEVDAFQGYYFKKPIEAKSCIELLIKT